MNSHYKENGLQARKVVRAIITDGQQFIFEKRPVTATTGPNRLQLFGGKVDRSDHSLTAALVRELAEELNLAKSQINRLKLVAVELSPDFRWLSFFFFVEVSQQVFDYLSAQPTVKLTTDLIQVESQPILDELTGSEIAFDHGWIILENIAQG